MWWIAGRAFRNSSVGVLFFLQARVLEQPQKQPAILFFSMKLVLTCYPIFHLSPREVNRSPSFLHSRSRSLSIYGSNYSLFKF